MLRPVGVQLQAPLRNVPLAAARKLTGERTFPGVPPQVDLQGGSLTELLAANFALTNVLVALLGATTFITNLL